MKPRIKLARDSALDLVERNGIAAAPVPVERIARKLGIQIRRAPLGGDLSGMATIREGVCIIGVNSLQAPQRQRFTLAHELGHFRLHRAILEKEVHLDRGSLRRDWLSSLGVDRHEMEANAFAAELLMPTLLLKDMLSGRSIDVEDEDDVDRLARRFQVSSAAMRYRLIRGTSEHWE